MNVSEVIGKRVMDRDAIVVGKVTDIDINTSAWTVASLVVKTGLAKKLVVGVDKVGKIGDEIFLTAARDELL